MLHSSDSSHTKNPTLFPKAATAKISVIAVAYIDNKTTVLNYPDLSVTLTFPSTELKDRFIAGEAHDRAVYNTEDETVAWRITLDTQGFELVILTQFLKHNNAELIELDSAETYCKLLDYDLKDISRDDTHAFNHLTHRMAQVFFTKTAVTKGSAKGFELARKSAEEFISRLTPSP